MLLQRVQLWSEPLWLVPQCWGQGLVKTERVLPQLEQLLQARPPKHPQALLLAQPPQVRPLQGQSLTLQLQEWKQEWKQGWRQEPKRRLARKMVRGKTLLAQR